MQTQGKIKANIHLSTIKIKTIFPEIKLDLPLKINFLIFEARHHKTNVGKRLELPMYTGDIYIFNNLKHSISLVLREM